MSCQKFWKHSKNSCHEFSRPQQNMWHTATQDTSKTSGKNWFSTLLINLTAFFLTNSVIGWRRKIKRFMLYYVTPKGVS